METIIIASCIVIVSFCGGYMFRLCQEIQEIAKKY
jgi:hypothetical protein